MKVDRDLDGDFVDELVQSGVELARLGLRGRDTHPEQRVARLQGAEADAEVADVTGRRLQAGAGERTRQLTRLAVAQRPIETQRRHACDERERRLVNVQAHQVDGHLRTLADALQRHADADARQADHVNVHFVLKKKEKKNHQRQKDELGHFPSRFLLLQMGNRIGNWSERPCEKLTKSARVSNKHVMPKQSTVA